MSATSSSATQQKFTNLRKRLDQLGYRHPLGIESLPLVERLFSDLVHTTDSLKKTKLDLSKAPVDKGSVNAHIEAFKSDNARLVKENTELHQQLIKAKEQAEVYTKDLKASLRKLEHENADLCFLNNQYVHKIRALERDSKSKNEKILQLQEKNLHAVVQTPGGKKKNIPFRRQRMEMDCPPPPAQLTMPALPYSKDPYVADLLRVADDNMAKVKDENIVLMEERDGLEVKIDSFRKQIDARDAELARMTGLLEGGRPYDVVALDARNRSNERVISHLNIQIDYLQQKNADLQGRLNVSEDRAHTAIVTSGSLDNRNVELESELQTVDRMAQKLQLDRETTVKAADREITEAKFELERLRQELQTVDVEMAQLRAERDNLQCKLEDLRADLHTQKAGNGSLQDLLARVQEDKRRLGVRVNKLVSNEKELVLAIDRLKHSKNGMNRRGKSPNHMENFIKGIEEERNYWKCEVEVLQKLLKAAATPRVNSPARARKSSPTKVSSRSASPSRTMSPKNSAKLERSATQDSVVRMLEEERDHYRRECDILKTRRTASPIRTTSIGLSSDSEVAELRRERDELQALLDKFERHMSEIQANVKVLTSERDKINSMYESTKDELGKLRRDVVRSPKSPKTSLAAQAVLRRVEHEREEAIVSMRKVTTERDTLRERLKIATETQLTDRARLEQRCEDLETALEICERERNDADDKAITQQRLLDSLEIQARELNVRLARSEDDTAQHQATATQMRLLAEQEETVATDGQMKLRQREIELRNMEERTAHLDDRIMELEAARDHDLQEMARLKSTISALDREKDALQSAVDEKTERIATMTDKLHTKERVIGDMNVNTSEMDGAIQRMRDVISNKEHEIGSLRRQLDSTTEELTEVGRAREVALRENRRLQDDLATMTRENQKISTELQDAVGEREDLRDQVQDYFVEVKKTEEIISSKENERSDLLTQYRQLSVEAEHYETQTHQLESEGSNLRLEMMTKEGEVKRLREKIEVMDSEIREHMNTERAYEHQVSDLTKSHAAMENEIRRLEGDKHGGLQDVAAVRDLCTRLEASKDQLQRHLTAKSLDYEKLQGVVDDMKSENALLKQQISSERSSVNNLESVLHNNREKEFQSQLSAQELESENQLLRDRLALNESKMESLTREISSLRSKCIEMESEIERLKRLLTNEKFERERAVQELRRNGLAPPGDSRLSSANETTLRSTSPARRSSRSPYRRDDR